MHCRVFWVVRRVFFAKTPWRALRTLAPPTYKSAIITDKPNAHLWVSVVVELEFTRTARTWTRGQARLTPLARKSQALRCGGLTHRHDSRSALETSGALLTRPREVTTPADGGFHPTQLQGELGVLVKSAAGLTNMDWKGLSDPFCKVGWKKVESAFQS